jgi:3-deoxy-D-manno-octulosonic-acid transferase
MYLLYSILLGIGVVALLPRFLFDAARHGKYAAGLGERAGRLPVFDAGGRPVLWLHCVSVGETQAARPLARALLEAYPSHALVVSTTTQTGQRVARELFGQDAALVFYFPFDWAWSVRRALEAIKPSAVLVMETELWPRFYRECRERRIPVALVNGRISEKSFRRYRLIKSFIKRAVADLSLAIMQTNEDAGRIAALGLPRERVRVSGNIKFDSEEAEGAQALTAELRERFGLDGERPLVVAASTHSPEERIVVEAFKLSLAAPSSTISTSPTPSKRPRLLIAPRHPERFAEVASRLEASGLSWSRRSGARLASDASSDVILLDTIGELRSAYPLAEVVFVGGSIAQTGGHNVLEPALAARCIVTGAHTFNFTSIVRSFLEHQALVQLPPLGEAEAPEALARVLVELLGDEEKRRATGERARAALEMNRGATARTVEMLAPILQERSEARGQRPVKDKILASSL